MLEESTLDGLTTTQRRALEASLPKGRLIAPEEIVALVWWVCEDEAAAARRGHRRLPCLGVHPGLITGPHHDEAARAAA